MFFFFFFRPLVAVTSHVIHKIVFHSLFFSLSYVYFLLITLIIIHIVYNGPGHVIISRLGSIPNQSIHRYRYKKKKKKQCRSVIATLSLTRSLNNFNRNKTLFMLAR